jgi:hypothetical protein
VRLFDSAAEAAAVWNQRVPPAEAEKLARLRARLEAADELIAATRAVCEAEQAAAAAITASVEATQRQYALLAGYLGEGEGNEIPG